MFPGEDNSFENDYAVNPYESFMRKHLQHYGYYTGKNQNYKNQFHQYAEWEKNYAYDLRGSSSESESDSDDDDDKNEACSSEAEVANDHILAARARSCFGFRSTDNENDSKLQDDLLRTTQLIYSWGESGKMVPKLREPRSLYALNKELGPQQAARWPANLQVLNERVHHIQQVTSEPEPFYKTTGYEKCPMVRGENNGGQVVFNYETNASFFMKSRVGGSRNGCEQCAISLSSEDDETLIFESRFESGNLAKAVKVNDSEYELWLHYDLYTNKHTQWFYFRVSNTRANKKYRFTIVNFIKPDSLYNNGMRPVMYSKKEAALNKVGWVRGGEDIKYYRNNIRYEVNRSERNYYSMTWTATCQHDHDTVYFSHCYPYTYTDLQDYLLELSNDPIKSRICRQRVLCRTLAGNLVYVLTITSSSQNPEDIKHKKAVIVTSRVHPGESNASWMMKGFLDFVTSSSPDAKLLRDTFIIKVVPMLNPDGVIVGNYRCSLAGRDLNRNYKTSLKDAYPSVWHTKNMIRKLLQERDIIVYCDLHGHSRRQNVFIYGCEQKHNSNKRFHERIFPSMLNKNCPDKFSFNSCKFKVQKSKDGTGRVVMWNMGIMNSYTLEATFCGSSLGKKKGFHFNQHDYEMMGYHFCDTLLDYCDPDNTKYANIMVDLEHRHQMEVMAKIAEKGLEPEQMGDLSDSDVESSDGGSDSSVSDGPPVHLQFAATRTKKKRLKSKKDRDNVRPPAKEDARRGSSIQEDKRMRNNQVKPLKHDSSRNHSMRYTNSSSPRQPRTTEERSNSGVPIYVQERVDEKNQKRHDYLEALTAAYINNNIPIVNDPDSEKRPSTSPSKQLPTAELWSGGSHNCIERQKSVVHFRYSGSHPTEKPQNPQNIEGLCPRHHEQNLHAQLAAMQSNTGAPIKTGNIQEQYQRMRSRDSAFKISRLVGRREARFSEGKVDDASQYHLNHTASIPPLDRRHKPHLLEVSAAQQRQTDLLSRDQNGPIKTHPNPFDEKGEKSDASCKVSTNVPKSHIPSATSYVNYNTFSVSQVRGPNPKEESGGQEEHIDHNGHRERNGRKSRRGMRDDEDNGDSAMFNEKSRPVFDIKGSSTSHTPRVKSAHSTAAMANTLSSIQELQKSLKGANTIDGSEAAASGTTTTGAGEYIQKLIKETNEEIEGLTNEIQEDIEKKHQNHHRSKHFDENGSLASPQLKGYNNKKKSASEIGKSPLGLSYHGGTFISEIGSASKSVDRVKSISGHLGGKSITQTSSASQITVSKGPSVAAKPGEYVPYTGSTFNSNINKFYGGPKLMVSTERQKETVLEEEARTRNVMRQSSLNAARNGQLPNDGTTRNPSKQLAAAPTNGKNSRHGRTDYTNPSNNPSHNNTADTDVRLYSSNGQRSNNSANSVRLTKKNLIFRTSEGTRVTTPRETYQPSDQDARGNELGDGTEKLCLPKSH